MVDILRKLPMQKRKSYFRGLRYANNNVEVI